MCANIYKGARLCRREIVAGGIIYEAFCRISVLLENYTRERSDIFSLINLFKKFFFFLTQRGVFSAYMYTLLLYARVINALLMRCNVVRVFGRKEKKNLLPTQCLFDTVGYSL